MAEGYIIRGMKTMCYYKGNHNRTNVELHYLFQCFICGYTKQFCSMIEVDSDNRRGFNMYCVECDTKRQQAIVLICLGGK